MKTPRVWKSSMLTARGKCLGLRLPTSNFPSAIVRNFKYNVKYLFFLYSIFFISSGLICTSGLVFNGKINTILITLHVFIGFQVVEKLMM